MQTKIINLYLYLAGFVTSKAFTVIRRTCYLSSDAVENKRVEYVFQSNKIRASLCGSSTEVKSNLNKSPVSGNFSFHFWR